MNKVACQCIPKCCVSSLLLCTLTMLCNAAINGILLQYDYLLLGNLSVSVHLCIPVSQCTLWRPPNTVCWQGRPQPGAGSPPQTATGHRAPPGTSASRKQGGSTEERRGMRCSAAQPPAVRPMRRRSGLGVLPRLSRGASVSAFVSGHGALSRSGERGPRPHTCHCTHTARWLLVEQKRASAAPSVCGRAR